MIKEEARCVLGKHGFPSVTKEHGPQRAQLRNDPKQYFDLTGESSHHEFCGVRYYGLLDSSNDSGESGSNREEMREL